MGKLPYINRTPNKEAEWFQALIDLARYLRGPGGCPWDREQSSRDFAAFAAEEAKEVLDAYSAGDNDDIAEEVGDTLFTLLASVAAGEEEGRYTLKQILESAHEKMVRRHEHVFGDEKATTPEAAIDSWNRVKAKEKKRKTSRGDSPIPLDET